MTRAVRTSWSCGCRDLTLHTSTAMAGLWCPCHPDDAGLADCELVELPLPEPAVVGHECPIPPHRTPGGYTQPVACSRINRRHR